MKNPTAVWLSLFKIKCAFLNIIRKMAVDLSPSSFKNFEIQNLIKGKGIWMTQSGSDKIKAEARKKAAASRMAARLACP